MQGARPFVLSIAGFDPSAGAGLLADVKTMEQNGVYGLGVVSALTWQNDITFDRVEWIDVGKIISQVKILLARFPVRHIKIGLIENMDVLFYLLKALYGMIENPVIVYDPILKASAGFEFYSPNTERLEAIYQRIYCITPNIPEAQILLNSKEKIHEKLLALSKQVNVYLKGGHGDSDMITDTIFTKGETVAFTNPRIPNGPKHGSGCVLSAALISQLALGNDLIPAAKSANAYTNRFLGSNDSLLGYHNNG